MVETIGKPEVEKADIEPSDATAIAGMALGALLSLAAPQFPGLVVVSAALGGLLGKKLGKRAEHD